MASMVEKFSATDLAYLHYNPFEGDRDSNCLRLRDKFVITRKPHLCTICREDILVDQRVRARTEVSRDERKTVTFYFCIFCCHAMAKSGEDGGRLIERRTQIGISAAFDE
jgi:hypothetical protein